MKITDLELANAVIANQEEQISKLSRENNMLKKEIINKRSGATEWSIAPLNDKYGPVIIHEGGPSYPKGTKFVIPVKESRWYEFWK